MRGLEAHFKALGLLGLTGCFKDGEILIADEENGVWREPTEAEAVQIIDLEPTVIAQEVQEKENREARAFLAATDYKVIKELERILADQINPAALEGRQAARNRVIDNEVA